MHHSRIILALVIWSVFGLVYLISARAYGSERNHIVDANKMVSPIPPGLQRIMAEGAGDVRAIVAWIGEAKAVEMAREAGASEAQLRDAKRCSRN
jgi:hypothetical protein